MPRFDLLGLDMHALRVAIICALEQYRIGPEAGDLGLMRAPILDTRGKDRPQHRMLANQGVKRGYHSFDLRAGHVESRR